MAKLTWALLALVLLASLPPAAAKAEPSRVVNDFADLRGDVILAGRDTDRLVERPSMDVVRVQQALEGRTVTLTLSFAGVVGEPDLSLSVLSSMGSRLGEGANWDMRWGFNGTAPASTTAMTTVGGIGSINVTATNESERFVMRFDLPEAATCFSAHTIHLHRKVSNAEYDEWVYPVADPCDANDRLDGAQGACPPALAKVDMNATLTDERDDVRKTDAFGQPGAVEAGHARLDIVGATSRREGDRVVQTVTLGAPRNETGELKVTVVSRFAGGQDRDEDPEHAVLARYWRFQNISQPDRVEGELVDGDAGEQDKVDAPVALQVDGATFTFSWCASLVPADAACWGVEVEVESRPTIFAGGHADVARAAVDPCLGAAGAVATPTPPTEASPDEEPVEEEPVEDEGEAQETPMGALPALGGLLVALALARRLSR